MRLDKYLKISRLIKRRTVANEACDAGRVLVNDRPAKASAQVKAGDTIEIQFGSKNVKVEVLDIKETVRKKTQRIFFAIFDCFCVYWTGLSHRLTVNAGWELWGWKKKRQARCTV